jgi:hypothetical protein
MMTIAARSSRSVKPRTAEWQVASGYQISEEKDERRPAIGDLETFDDPCDFDTLIWALSIL